MSLFSGLGAAANALAAFEAALTVTQNNVNNASTPGYVTQTQSLQALSFVPGTGASGGVVAGAVLSSRDQYAEQNVRGATAQLGNFQQQVETLGNLQNQFDISGSSGIPAAFNSLFSAFSNWSNLPNDSTARQNVITQAQATASAFQQATSNIAKITQGADTQTASLVDQVNTLAGQIAGYNLQLAAGSQSDAGLDAAVNSTIENLSQIADVTTIKQADGTFSVMLGGQTELVAGKAVNKLTASIYVPTRPVINSGGPVAVPIHIIAGVNDTLNLKIDGTTLPPITLNSADTSLAAVVADINTQLAPASPVVASADTQGRLVLTSAGAGASASVQILPGSVNADLGLTAAVPPQARLLDSNGNDVTGQVTGGKLAGILAVRNQMLSSIQGDGSQTGSLNQLAKAFADRVNTLMGVPVFSYDSNSATGVARSLQLNSSLTAQKLPNAQVIALTGTAAPASPIAITPGTNDKLNLSVDGTTWPTITLNAADTTPAAVAADLNTQFVAAGIGAMASVNANSGALVIATTNTAATASIQILPGTANATLGLAQTTPTYQSGINGVALSLSALASPKNPSDEINGQSFTQFFGSIAAQVGAQLSLAKNGQSSQRDILTQAQSLRQQISGVDLNMEATKVLEFQRAYQASSKILTVIDSLTQTVLGLIPGA